MSTGAPISLGARITSGFVNRCSVWIGVTWEDEGDHCRAGWSSTSLRTRGGACPASGEASLVGVCRGDLPGEATRRCARGRRRWCGVRTRKPCAPCSPNLPSISPPRPAMSRRGRLRPSAATAMCRRRGSWRGGSFGRPATTRCRRSRIEAQFRTDHSTVLRGIRRCELRRAEDADWWALMDKLKARLGPIPCRPAGRSSSNIRRIQNQCVPASWVITLDFEPFRSADVAHLTKQGRNKIMTAASGNKKSKRTRTLQAKILGTSKRKRARAKSKPLNTQRDATRKQVRHKQRQKDHAEQRRDNEATPLSADLDVVGLMNRRTRAFLELPTRIARCHSPFELWSEQSRFMQGLISDCQSVAQQLMMNALQTLAMTRSFRFPDGEVCARYSARWVRYMTIQTIAEGVASRSRRSRNPNRAVAALQQF